MPLPGYRTKSIATPRAIQSSATHARQIGNARTTQIGARFEPLMTPSAAMAIASPMTAADSHAAFRHHPRNSHSART